MDKDAQVGTELTGQKLYCQPCLGATGEPAGFHICKDIFG